MRSDSPPALAGQEVIFGRDRAPFFRVVAESAEGAPIPHAVDLGAGSTDFAFALPPDLNVTLLDRTPVPVMPASPRVKVRTWRAPDRMPFDDAAVGLVHASHLIEHLTADELVLVLAEADRVLAPGGLLAVSAPLWTNDFYNDITHIRPYTPDSLSWYLTGKRGPTSRSPVARHYVETRRVYRARRVPLFADVAGSSRLSSGVARVWRVGAEILGLHRVMTTGYTIIWRKSPP